RRLALREPTPSAPRSCTSRRILSPDTAADCSGAVLELSAGLPRPADRQPAPGRPRSPPEPRAVAPACAGATGSFRSGVVPVAVALAAAAVVRAKLAAVARVAAERLVELRRVLDLVLRAVHGDALVRGVDPRDHAGGEHDLLPEDPWP